MPETDAVTYKRKDGDQNTIILHGSACPYHCVCNGSHRHRGCWCYGAQGKAARPRTGWREALRYRLRGGGRARGRFDCPC